MKSIEILQITPANGWRAVYVREDYMSGTFTVDGACTVADLVCFAAIEDLDTGDQEVVGMVPEGADIVPCVSPTFLGYIAASRPLHEMQPQLDAWVEAQIEHTRKTELEKEIREEQSKPPDSDPDSVN